jgi:hypothetical protein
LRSPVEPQDRRSRSRFSTDLLDFGSKYGADGHDGNVRKAGFIVAVPLMLALGAAVSTAAEAAPAAPCAGKITISGPTSGHLVLTPSSAKLQLGTCVAFDNATDAKVMLTVVHDGKTVYGTTTVGRGQTTSRSASFAPAALGQDTVAATSRAVLVLPVKGSATITVTPAPSVSPTASPTPGGTGSSTPVASPDVAPSPKNSKHPNPKPTGIKLPPLPPLPSSGATGVPQGSNPLVAPGPTSPPTTLESQTPVAQIVAGPLEPPDDNSRGLPEAVGVIVVLGLATGWGRVLLAQPRAVDDRPHGDHRL